MKPGIYQRKLDGKLHKLLGVADAKYANKKGKVHLGKIIVNGDYVNLFKSASGCYLCTLEGELIYDKVAILSVNKEGREIYFSMTKNAFMENYKRKQEVC